MSKSNPGTEETLRKELTAMGAREFEVVALTMDPGRGSAALAYAIAKGAERPIPYAIAVFDNPDWHPSGDKARVATNVAVQVTCATCNGDRFVEVTNDPTKLYGETYKPCPDCNTSVDAGFWRPDGSRFVVAK